MTRIRLGIDVGGSGIKAAPVDVDTGELVAERQRIATPQPATPDAIAQTVAALSARFAEAGVGGRSIGATMPGVVKHGRLLTAANIDDSWIGVDVDALFSQATGNAVTVLNDADAAGVAEMRFGAGAGRDGVVVMITLGTGIGFAVFNDGVLLPNVEMGHLEMNGKDAEHQASARVREENDESWEHWAHRVDQYLDRVDALLWPDLIIIGGGVSKKADKFFPYLNTRAELAPAALRNDAGIIGAALVAAESELELER